MILIDSVLLCISYQQVLESYRLTTSDERVISVLAEAFCISALQSNERHFLDNIFGNPSRNFFRWFRKARRIASKDSSVIIYKLFEEEIIENVKFLLENFNSTKNNLKPKETESKHYWWMPSGHMELEKIGGPEFSAWTSEYAPAYKLQINADRFNTTDFKGWRNYEQSWWEVLLTHSQMVCHSFIHCLDFRICIVLCSCCADLENLHMLNCPYTI